MRITVLLLALVCSTAAIAQEKAAAPASKAAAQKAKPKAAPAKPKPQSIAVRLQACLDIDDGTKERLNCYDAVFAPVSKPKAAAAKSVAECRFTKEEDERLTCFNGFVEKLPKLPTQ